MTDKPQVKREHAGIVMLCDCPRREELTHSHREQTGGTEKIGVGGKEFEVPATREVMVKGGAPRIVLRTDTPNPLDAENVERLVGTCKRCGEIFRCTITLTEAGTREPGPPAKEDADGDAGS